MRLAALIAITVCIAFGADDSDPVLRVGNGVTPPRVTHKVDPAYTPEAHADRIQGSALYSIVVGKDGKPRDIELLSPIGYGLDEAGAEAIRQWTFAPATKNGVAVSVLAQIEVNFRFMGTPFDAKTEQRRTKYNAAIHNLQDPAKKQKAVEEISKLAAEQYPPGMAMLGLWMIEGTETPKDVAAGIELGKKAADKYDATGLFVMGKLYMDGQLVPPDAVKGLKMMQDASVHGSERAQFSLGVMYESGTATTAADPERAKRYFRLCAARGQVPCEFRLGRLLAPAPGTKGDPVQALAWLELARDGSVKAADPLVHSLEASLSADEIGRAAKLKAQLLLK